MKDFLYRLKSIHDWLIAAFKCAVLCFQNSFCSYITITVAAIIGVCSSCIDQIDIQGPETAESLVVEAWFTDNVDHNYISLSWTAAFSNTFPNYGAGNRPAEGAVVKVHLEDRSETISFFEHSAGTYLANGVAEVGQSYVLEILIDGKRYTSQPEMVNEVAEVESVTYEVNTVTTLVESFTGSTYERKRYEFDVFAEFNPTSPRGNYYYWRTGGIEEFFSTPRGDGPCNECTCYYYDRSLNQFIRTGDDLNENEQFIKKKVAIVPYDRLSRYLVTVYQYSMTLGAYEYWSLVEDQHTNVGSIFDPAPARIRSNIAAVNDNDAEDTEIVEVFGYFMTSAVAEGEVLVDRAAAIAELGLVPPNLKSPIEGDCRNQIPGAFSDPVPPQFQR